MSEEKRKVYSMVMVLALLLCGFLMGVFAMSMYNASQDQLSKQAWAYVASDNINDQACIHVAAMNNQQLDPKFMVWCKGELAKHVGHTS